ncbi:hypothetical protein FB451DRAFT_1176299 [Mycena latifolia]|nr:hypothetical protein FB451DRAFT_1176299 [Mycena latifolia]
MPKCKGQQMFSHTFRNPVELSTRACTVVTRINPDVQLRGSGIGHRLLSDAGLLRLQGKYGVECRVEKGREKTAALCSGWNMTRSQKKKKNRGRGGPCGNETNNALLCNAILLAYRPDSLGGRGKWAYPLRYTLRASNSALDAQSIQRVFVRQGPGATASSITSGGTIFIKTRWSNFRLEPQDKSLKPIEASVRLPHHTVEGLKSDSDHNVAGLCANPHGSKFDCPVSAIVCIFVSLCDAVTVSI